MKTIQITIDEGLLAEIDRDAACRGDARSAWLRDAARTRLERARIQELERQHREAYRESPQTADETEWLSAWEKIQDWPEDDWSDVDPERR